MNINNARKWVIWLGGWESPTRGWHFDTDPYPISVFGHLATFFGSWGQVRWFGGYIVWFLPWRRRMSSCDTVLFWSPNGTPQHARARMLIGNRVAWNRDR